MSGTEPQSPELPLAFGKYLLSELIAVGGMAEVYKAKIFGASGFEKEMVVKRILPRYAKNPSFVQMLIDEAKIAVRLTHGNIVPIYELGELEGTYYIAMEYVEGSTLLDVLRLAHEKQKPLPPAFSLGIAAAVAAGLSYAHKKVGDDGEPLGLVHRDINPRNIVITPSGEVKILDFGIARASTKKHQTKSGVIKGTPGYMSPEQMYGFTVDHRSDQFCVGILVYELLTLLRLYPAWTVQEMRDLYEQGPPTPPSSKMTGLPPEVDAVVLKALSKRPEDRYDDTGDFEEALREVIVKTQVAVTSTGLARSLTALREAPVPVGRSPLTAGPPTSAARPKSIASSSGETQRASGLEAASSSGNAAPGSEPGTGSEPNASSPPTEPMANQPKEGRPATGKHAFVISMDDKAEKPEAFVPFPVTSMKEGDTPKTQVLALNDELGWGGAIKSDAELLALAKAAGSAPGQTKKVIVAAALFAAVAFLTFAAFNAGDFVTAVTRAFSGTIVRPGAVIVKTRPAGARVVLDGVEKGLSNLKLINIDPDVNHTLVVHIEGKDPMTVDFKPGDFRPADGLPTYFFEQEPVEVVEVDAGMDEVEPEKKPTKRRRRRGRKRK